MDNYDRRMKPQYEMKEKKSVSLTILLSLFLIVLMAGIGVLITFLVGL
jgi:flagellar basal body-associated protein FliL